MMLQWTEIGKAFEDAQKQYVEPFKEALHCVNEESERIFNKVLTPAMKEVVEVIQMGYKQEKPLIGEHDRWLIDGDCRECRRAKYCTKLCKLHKRRLKELLDDEIQKGNGVDVIKRAAERAYGE